MGMLKWFGLLGCSMVGITLHMHLIEICGLGYLQNCMGEAKASQESASSIFGAQR